MLSTAVVARFPSYQLDHCSGFGERRNERLTDGSAKIKSLQRWEPGLCDLICILQKAWALLGVVSTKGTGFLVALRDKGVAGPRDWEGDWWLLTVMIKWWMTDGFPPLLEESSSRCFAAAAVVLRQGLLQRGPVSNSVWSRMSLNHWSSCPHLPCVEISGLYH